MLRGPSTGMLAGSIGVVVGFPILYAGISYRLSSLAALGLVIFALGILFQPASRLLPRRGAPGNAAPAARPSAKR